MNFGLHNCAMCVTAHPRHDMPCNRLASLLLWALLVLSSTCLSSVADAAQVDIAGPPGSVAFGTAVTVLPNGNIVVTDPKATVSSVTRAGAVYLYSPTGSLISTLTGSSYLDAAGSRGVVVVGTSNFVVLSPGWSSASASHVGAATWVNGSTGLNGVVSTGNSLVGTSSSDFVANGAITLSTGNYVVLSPSWNGVGAATWSNGSAPTFAAVSTSNSLYGTITEDGVGSSATALTNGNYVVASGAWNNGTPGSRVGAVTWIDGSGSFNGSVTTTNSLYGTTTNDHVGDFGATALTNGNYVVASPDWNNGTLSSFIGAATWGNGLGGTTGPVTTNNSLYGSATNDSVALGTGSILALTNGNYVVLSHAWSGSTGATTWGSGVSGVTGPVSSGNSLVGSGVGQLGVALMGTGNYVAVGNGTIAWGNGNGGAVGTVSASNSLFGGGVGAGVVAALSDGNYVATSPLWNNGATLYVGAATWGNGSTGTVGQVTASNSLIGTTADDRVGESGIVALNNGAYAVGSYEWHNGVGTSVGAVTLIKNIGPYTGTISAGNSLIGTAANDRVGIVRSLNDGNYLVDSPQWDNGAIVDAGAITLASGGFRLVGKVALWNSVLGGVTNGGATMVHDYDPTRHQLAVGRPAENIVSLFTMDQIFADNFEP